MTHLELPPNHINNHLASSAQASHTPITSVASSMAKPPYVEEDCMKYYKTKYHTHKSKSLSFFALMFSLSIYISIIYIFNLSPYTLFNNNIFWFFMSNTLILIIAADYGAFSSSKKKKNLYEEYVLHGQQRNFVTTSYVPKYEQVDKQCIEMGGNLLHEKKETITDESPLKRPTISREISLLSTGQEGIIGNQKKHSEIIPERVLEIVTQDKPKKASECSNYKKQVLPLKVDDSYKEFEEKAIHARIGRSKSDRYHRDRVKSVVVDERKKRVRRSETMKVEEAKLEEENDFSNMTNEDLNKRVEEFIQKSNRQIRLQATRNDNNI